MSSLTRPRTTGTVLLQRVDNKSKSNITLSDCKSNADDDLNDNVKLPILTSSHEAAKVSSGKRKGKVQLKQESSILVGVSSIKGKRNYMEDFYCVIEQLEDHTFIPPPKASDEEVQWTSFFGVFDGHAGKKCSKAIHTSIPQLLKRHQELSNDLKTALRESFLAADRKFLAVAKRTKSQDGSTACTVCRRGDTLYMCNTGDSRAILSKEVISFFILDCLSHQFYGIQGVAIPLTQDHKPGDLKERQRIFLSGGKVRIVFGVARVNGVLSVSRGTKPSLVSIYQLKNSFFI